MKVAVIYGGGSSEQESSYKSAKSIAESLGNLGYSNVILHFENNIADVLIEQGIEIVFIATQGKKCGDGTLQAILDRLDIAYTGSNMTAAAVCNDKIICKKLMTEAGIPTPRYTTLTRDEDCLKKIRDNVGFPCVVKAPHEGSSYGLDFIDTPDDIDKIESLYDYDDRLLVEERIRGIDLTLPILEDNGVFTLLPLIEMRPKNGLNTTFSKFTPGQIEYPMAVVPDEIIRQAQCFSQKLFESVGARGYGRVDMILSGNDLYVLEINVVPGLSESSIFPIAANFIGISKDELIRRVLRSATYK